MKELFCIWPLGLHTDLGDAPDGATEGGVVAADDGAAHQRVSELGGLLEVVLLIGGGFVLKAWEGQTGELR